MSFIKEIKGTAGEAYQMSHYNDMINKYGEDVALGIMKPELKKCGISVNEFQNYVNVKRAIQNGSLKVTRAKRNAEALSENVLSEIAA
ncbi:hypothetical protein ACPEEL_01440 [Pasteurella sp. PK-2025]|uniref:hypothetical protein n=1 Tax=unclassified Pasteurella TaxID=2621516 RepID=UPI003C73DBA1